MQFLLQRVPDGFFMLLSSCEGWAGSLVEAVRFVDYLDNFRHIQILHG